VGGRSGGRRRSVNSIHYEASFVTVGRENSRAPVSGGSGTDGVSAAGTSAPPPV
jgi:hypothetical protein